MPDWTIETPADFEHKWRAQHGDAEYERRLTLANAKAQELAQDESCGGSHQEDDADGEGALDSFAETIILRPQFQSMVMALGPAAMVKAERLSGRAWANIFYKLAGV